MKYEIEILIASVKEDNKDEIRKILNGDIYDVISCSESGGLMDEKETRAESEEIDRRDFDEKSLELFGDIDL